MAETTTTPAVLAEPSVVDMGRSSEANVEVYQKWAVNYEKDMLKWGYEMPDRMATVLKQHLAPKACSHILDAGAGDGLSGVAFKKVFGSTKLTALDICQNMLDIAAKRGCYDELKVVDLNKQPLPLESDCYDAITCLSTLTYVEPPVLTEFIRVCKPGGLICYSQRTDKLADYDPLEQQLQEKGLWKPVERLGPFPFIPGNPEFGDKIEVILFLWQRAV